MPTTEGYNGAYTGQQLDAGIAKANSAVQPDGSVAMTGALNMGGQKVTNVGAPSAATDAVRQQDLEVVSQEVDHILDGTTPAYIPPATTAKIGGVIVGDGLSVAESGDLSVNADASPTQSSTNPVQSGGVYNALQGYIPTTQKGAASGVAQLDENGLVPAAQLPGFVDDIVDAYVVGSTPYAQDWLSLTSGGTALTPDASKIYLVVSAGDYQNQQFRWSGTQYGQVSPSIALGETANTAYYGDKGKTAYDHSQITSGNPHGTTAAQVGAITAPSGGTEGQVLTKTTEGTAWEDAPSGLPTGGTPGQVLTKTASGAEWGDAPSDLPEGGTNGQILTKTSDGVAWEDAPEGGVTSFNSRTGAVIPQSGDYTAEMVGARPSTWTPSAADVGAVPTTRTVNGKALSDNISLTAGDVGAVPTSRKVNNKPLSSDVTLTAADVGAGTPSTSTTITLTTSGWTGDSAPFSQQVACSIVAADTPVVSVDVDTPGTDADADNEAINAWALVSQRNPAQGAGTLTFYCNEKPTVNIPVKVGVS